MYIDTHCHLDLPHFTEDLSAVVDRALKAGIGRMVNPGVDLPSSLRIISLAKKFAEIKAAIGIHPNDLSEDYPKDIETLRSVIKTEPVIAIGEIGLDAYHKRVSMELQIKGLRAQLDLADDFRLPVIIHSRDTLNEMLPILSSWASQRDKAGLKRPYGVMHSFEGNVLQANEFIAMGFLISIAGPVTYKNAFQKHELVKDIPLGSLVLETDSPYLTPIPYRGQRNEPAYLPLIGQRTAIIRECAETFVMETTTQNALELFLLE